MRLRSRWTKVFRKLVRQLQGSHVQLQQVRLGA